MGEPTIPEDGWEESCLADLTILPEDGWEVSCLADPTILPEDGWEVSCPAGEPTILPKEEPG